MRIAASYPPSCFGGVFPRKRMVAHASGASRPGGPVAHVIGELAERRAEKAAQLGVAGEHVEQRAVHAREPLVALGLADGKRQVAGTQPRMAEALHVARRPA